MNGLTLRNCFTCIHRSAEQEHGYNCEHPGKPGDKLSDAVEMWLDKYGPKFDDRGNPPPSADGCPGFAITEE